MSREEILQRMDEAFKEDRERFFKVADTLSMQPKYTEYKNKIEELKQQMRDIPQQEEYPNIDWPIKLPDWFPKVYFASSWEKDTYLEEELSGEERMLNFLSLQSQSNKEE